MLVVDAQVHIWANHKPTNPGHRQVTTFSKDDLLKEMDEAGVDAAVIHPPGWDPNSNEVAVEAARQHPAWHPPYAPAAERAAGFADIAEAGGVFLRSAQSDG